MVSYYLIISSFNTIQNKIHKPFHSTKKKKTNKETFE